LERGLPGGNGQERSPARHPPLWERIAARDPNRQTAEIQIRIALMNRFSALGTAEIVRVA
jgi:hypothetical protein